jgi:hypothetical protein
MDRRRAALEGLLQNIRKKDRRILDKDGRMLDRKKQNIEQWGCRI